MKLRHSEIEIIGRHLSKSLLDGGFVQAADSEELQNKMVQVIVEDLQVEDKLNEEVRNLLTEHRAEIEKSTVEYHRMFNLVKAKLIKERNLIL